MGRSSVDRSASSVSVVLRDARPGARSGHDGQPRVLDVRHEDHAVAVGDTITLPDGTSAAVVRVAAHYRLSGRRGPGLIQLADLG